MQNESWESSLGRPDRLALTAVLLAGGLSRRMGCDKATLILDGQPLWSRQLALLRELSPAAIWVSARVAPAWLPADTELILDVPPSRGPLTGIAEALNRMNSSHLLALAVDLPRMTVQQLCKTVSLAGPTCGVIPRNEHYWEPLAAVYPKAAAPLARSALHSEDVSLQSFSAELLRRGLLREYRVPPEERRFYTNLNSRNDVPC